MNSYIHSFLKIKACIMQISNFNSTSFLIIFSFSAALLLSACSSNNEVNSVTAKSSSDKKIVVQKTKLVAKDLKHTHPSNPCTVALEHSHLYENEIHKHSYDCENTNDFVSNAHVHPATKTVRKYRHVHPNGANKHSHQR
ncbi:MAG: hypothetical protein V7749_04120 [Cocleimonas sp.]